MSLYKDKDQSEIDTVINQFSGSFKVNYGSDIDKHTLISYLNFLLKKKEQELMESALGSLSPKSIKLMIETLSDKEKPVIEAKYSGAQHYEGEQIIKSSESDQTQLQHKKRSKKQ